MDDNSGNKNEYILINYIIKQNIINIKSTNENKNLKINFVIIIVHFRFSKDVKLISRIPVHKYSTDTPKRY